MKSEMLLKKNQTITIEIKKIVFGGEGLGYYENSFAVFVPMSVPGDILEIEIISLKKTYGRGIIKKILTPSPERIENLNLITFEDFQGCDFGMLKYESQLKYKKNMVQEVVNKIGKIESVEVEDVLESPLRENYRNKIVEPFSLYNNTIITGFFKRKSHDVFEVEENILNSKLGNKIIFELKKILNEKNLSVYNEKEHKGILRHVMVRTNSFNEAMLVLVINENKIPEIIKNILNEMKSTLKEIVSIYVSLNNIKTNFALGKKNILVYGKKDLKENMLEILFNISPTSFFQINHLQAKRLYTMAINMIENLENKIVIDAYSGTGVIGLVVSKKAKKVYCIEIVKSAVEDGKKTAIENNIKNVEFICGDMNIELGKLVKKEKVDAIILDPPRKGVDENSLLNIAKTKINEIVYISCNPSTFARDINFLETLGYKLTEIKPVDMFPHTSHIEVIGKLEGK